MLLVRERFGGRCLRIPSARSSDVLHGAPVDRPGTVTQGTSGAAARRAGCHRASRCHCTICQLRRFATRARRVLASRHFRRRAVLRRRTEWRYREMFLVRWRACRGKGRISCSRLQASTAMGFGRGGAEVCGGAENYNCNCHSFGGAGRGSFHPDLQYLRAGLPEMSVRWRSLTSRSPLYPWHPLHPLPCPRQKPRGGWLLQRLSWPIGRRRRLRTVCAWRGRAER
jgi:hypothetical protein